VSGEGLTSSGMIAGWEPEDFDLSMIPPSRSPQRSASARFGTLGGRLGPVGELITEVEVQGGSDDGSKTEKSSGLTVLFT